MAAPRPKGNTRTGQDAAFTAVDTVMKTRETFDINEKADHQRNADTVAPDAAGMAIIDREQRIGRPMTTEQLTDKLHAINPAFVVKPSKSMPQRCNIYLPQWRQNDAGTWQKLLVHITSCENTGFTGQLMTEFSVITPVEETVPTEHGDRKRITYNDEVRGWRTVLAMLLTRGVITIGDVERHFSDPAKESARWNQLVN